MALALDVLSQSHDARAAFAAAGAADRLLSAISKHDKHAPVVGESIRALITLARYPSRPCHHGGRSEPCSEPYSASRSLTRVSHAPLTPIFHAN